MFHSSHDKHYLALLAIPVLLSMTLGFTGGVYTDSSLRDTAQVESDIDDEDDFSMSEKSRQEGKSYIHSHITSRDDMTSKKRDLIQNAIEYSDYKAFLIATSHTPFAEIMDEDAFAVLVQRYIMQKQHLPNKPTHLS